MYIWFMIIYRCIYKVIVVISWYFGCFEKKRGGGGWVFFYIINLIESIEIVIIMCWEIVYFLILIL